MVSLSTEEKEILTDACKSFCVGKDVALAKGEYSNLKVQQLQT